MVQKFITNFQKNNIVRNLVEDANVNQYYLFLGKQTDETEILDTDRQIVIDTYNRMTMAKQVEAVIPVIENIPYVLNTKYTAYDDTAVSNTSHAIVKEGTYYYVYRCLDNNFGANSTVQPVFSIISGSEDEAFRTNDGYLWKYLFRVSEDDYDKYSSSQYFPVMDISRNEIVDSGYLEVIKIEDEGLGYANYITGQFSGGDLYIDGDRKIFNISNTSVENVNGFYTGCLLYISSGTALGSYRYVTDFISNANGNFMYVDSDLNGIVNGDTYEVYPLVKVYNNGEQVNVIARAIPTVNTGNAITKIEILYSNNDLLNLTANIVANDVVSVSKTASIRPIYSPYGGHGYNVLNDLRSSAVCFYTKFSNTESNTILANTSFDKLGILRNPLYANVEIEVESTAGDFQVGENVYSIAVTYIGEGQAVADNVTMTVNNFYTTQNLANQWVYFTNSNGSFQQIAQINTISSSNLVFKEEARETANVSVYFANIVSTMTFAEQAGLSTIYVDKLTNPLSVADMLIGHTSGATAYVNSITRNDVSKGFLTFVQSTKYRVSSVGGTFQRDEAVYVGNNVSYFDGYLDDGVNKYVYVYDNNNRYESGQIMTGNTSGATATILEVYSPEFVYGSGDILYIENINEVTRNNSSEVIKLYMSC